MVDVTILNTTTYSRTGFVTVGIPFPSGELMSGNYLVVDGSTSRRENVQWYPQGARWGDNSVKYARATFPTSIGAGPYTDKTASVFKSTTANGASSTFTVPRQADINATRFQLAYKWKEFYKPQPRITGWETTTIPGVDSGTFINVTKITLTNLDSIREPDSLAYSYNPLYQRDKILGYDYEKVTNFPRRTACFRVNFAFAGYSTSTNFGVYGGVGGTTEVWATKGTEPNTVYVFASQATFPGRPTGIPDLTLDNRLNIGIWTPNIPSTAGVINLDLSTATLVEGDSSSNSHYRRYKVFARGDNSASGLPYPIWAEVVYNVYKNSDYIEYWFSWGNSYTEVSNGVPKTVGNPGTEGINKQHTHYYDGDVELRVYSTSTSTLPPRVSLLDSEYQLISGPTVSSGNVTTCVLLRSTDRMNFTVVIPNEYSGPGKRIGFDMITTGTTFGYKGFAVYTNTLTDSHRALLIGGGGDPGENTGRELQAIAEWQGAYPPYRSTIPRPDYVTSEADGKARTKRMIDRYESSGYMKRNPLQLGAMLAFTGHQRTGDAGSQGELYNLLTGHWSIIIRDPYPLRLIKHCIRKDLIRPVRRLKANGDMMRYLDHYISGTSFYYTDYSFHRENASTYVGLGTTKYNSNTSPAPFLQGVQPRLDPTVMDKMYAIVPSTTSTTGYEEVTGAASIHGHNKSHWANDYVYFIALVSMDYLALRQCEALITNYWSECWSGSSGGRGSIDIGGKRIETRSVSRLALAASRMLDIMGPGAVTAAAPEGEFLAEVKAGVRRIQSGYVEGTPNQAGHIGYVTSSLYGSDQYGSKIYPYSFYAPDPGGLAQEFACAPWLDFMAASHFWGLRKVLDEFGCTTEPQILKQIVKDCSAYVIQHTLVNTDDYTDLFFGEYAAADFNSSVDTVFPGDIVAGDVIYQVGDPSKRATVRLVTVDDTTEYTGTNSGLTWRTANRADKYKLKISLRVSNRINGPFSNSATFRIVRTGALFASRTGRTYTLIGELTGYKIGYYMACTPDPSVHGITNWIGGFGTDYYKAATTRESLYHTPWTYVYDETTEIYNVRGTRYRPYSSGLPRYGYLNNSVQDWGLGTLAIAMNLGRAGEYGSESTEIAELASDMYNYTVNNEVNTYNDDTWERSVGNNLFIENVDSTSVSVHRFPPYIELRLTQIQASGSGNGGGAAYTSVNYSGQVPAKVGIFVGRNNPIRYTVGTGIAYTGVLPAIVTTAIKSPTIDSVLSGTNVEIRPGTIALAGEFMQPPRDGVFGIQSDVNWQWRRTYTEDPYILSYSLLDPSDVTATTVFSASYSGSSPVELDMFIDDTDVRAYSTGPRGRIDWNRRIRTNFEDNPDPDPFTGIPGTYGDPMYTPDGLFGRGDGKLSEIQNEYMFNIRVGEYYDDYRIVNSLGYPSGQTILSGGFKVGPWTYLQYDEYLRNGSLYYNVEEVDESSPEVI